MTDQEWFNSFKASLKVTQVSLDAAVYLIKNSGVLTDEVTMADFFEFRQWVHYIRKTKEVDPNLSLESIEDWFNEIDNGSRRLDEDAKLFDTQSKIIILFKEAKSGLNHAWAVLDTGRIHFADEPSTSDLDQFFSSLESSFQSD